MKTHDFFYHLPEELIAQTPLEQRDSSRLLKLDRKTGQVEHHHFYDIVDLLDENCVLILNNTKVIPARLYGYKDTGAKIEIFLLKNKGFVDGLNQWETLIKPSKRVKVGTEIKISDELVVEVLAPLEDDGKWLVGLKFDGDLYNILDRVGNVPLPPYIERKMTSEELKALDYNRYQTVYAQKEGSVAAPTAGLHFTEDILNRLKEKGV